MLVIGDAIWTAGRETAVYLTERASRYRTPLPPISLCLPPSAMVKPIRVVIALYLSSYMRLKESYRKPRPAGGVSVAVTMAFQTAET